MSEYHLKISSKTHILNFFRRFFKFSFFEKILYRAVVEKKNSFARKFIPPNYIYKVDSRRTINRDDINYILDISNVVDHGIFWSYDDPGYYSVIEDLKKSNVILDIGANIGNSSLYYASINTSAKIYAFEPHPVSLNKAKENFAINNYKNINLVNCGLGDSAGKLKLYEVNDKNPGMNRIIKDDKNLPFKEIEVKTLDAFLEEEQISSLDFIKIDVEGFEYPVIEGGKKFISRYMPVMFIEVDDNNLKENKKSAKELITLLNSIGYKNIYRADNLEMLTVDFDYKNCHFDIVAKA